MDESYNERLKREQEEFETTGKRPLYWHISMILIWILWLNCFSAYDFTCRPIIYYIFGKEVVADIRELGEISSENGSKGIPGKANSSVNYSSSGFSYIYKDTIISFPLKDEQFQAKLDIKQKYIHINNKLRIHYLKFSPSSILIDESIFSFGLFCFFATFNIPVLIIMSRYILFCLRKIIEKFRTKEGT